MNMENKKQKHSELGIASFIVSIINGIAMIIINNWCNYLSTIFRRFMCDDLSFESLLYSWIVTLWVAIIAIGLGIVGLMHKDRKKVLPILGIICSLPGICYSGFWLLFVITWTP